MIATRTTAMLAGATALLLLAVTAVVGYLLLREPEPAKRVAADDGRPAFSLLADADVAGVPTLQDQKAAELGLRFVPHVDGIVDAARLLRASGDTGAHAVTLWDGNGKRLSETFSAPGSTPGWQLVPLPAPVPVTGGEPYVISYSAEQYRASPGFFTEPAQSGPLSTIGAGGVYTYREGGFPDQSHHNTNYWVDVRFKAGTTGPAPQELPLVEWEGGPAYYERFPAAKRTGWTDPAFFPTAVWFEGTYQQAEVDLDKAAGLNTYIELTADSKLPLIRENGMSALVSEQLPGLGAETTGWLLPDEADMWGKTGDGKWTGKFPGDGEVCAPQGTGCGHDVLRTAGAGLPRDDGRLRHANYGKGVVFWDSDEQSAAFVNGYTSVVSSDIYWYTDPNVCGGGEGPVLGVPPATCRRAANYGLVVDRMRRLDGQDGKRQPVYAFVEVGHPFPAEGAPVITGAQVAGAVLSSLIHEARGVIYFNHSFGGPCESQHVLRDCQDGDVRAQVTETNKRIRELAPVLNTQSARWPASLELDTMLKAYQGAHYLFAMPGRTGGTGEQRLTLPPAVTGSTAEVLFENRTVPVVGGVIQDTFATEHSYHIYKIA